MRLIHTLPLVLLLASCSKGPDTPAAAAPATAGRGGARGAGGPVSVTTGTVLERAMPVNLRAVGNVEAASTVEIRSQVSGELMNVSFAEGQDVTAGQLLFEIDPRTLEGSLKQAEAQLAKDSGQSRTAELQRTRYTNLQKAGLVSQADFDTVSAQANSLLSTIAADNVTIENIKLQLQFTKIRSPVTGRTGALLVHKGAIVRAADVTPMVVINQIAPVFVTFAVPARSLSEVRAEQKRGRLKVTAVVAGSEDPPSTGSITFIDNEVDAGSDTIRLKGSFPNGDHNLWPGQFVEVTLQLSLDPHAIVVPTTAVQPSQRGSFVYVVKTDKTVEARQVTVKRTEGTESVIESGLTAGESIVTDGQIALTPGARISAKPPAGGARQGQ